MKVKVTGEAKWHSLFLFHLLSPNTLWCCWNWTELTDCCVVSSSVPPPGQPAPLQTLMFEGLNVHSHFALLGLRRPLTWWSLDQNVQTEGGAEVRGLIWDRASGLGVTSLISTSRYLHRGTIYTISAVMIKPSNRALTSLCCRGGLS